MTPLYAQNFQFSPSQSLVNIKDGCYVYSKDLNEMACVDSSFGEGYLTLDIHILTKLGNTLKQKTYRVYDGEEGFEAKAVHQKNLDHLNTHLKRKHFVKGDLKRSSSHRTLQNGRILISHNGLYITTTAPKMQGKYASCCQSTPTLYGWENSKKVLVKFTRKCDWIGPDYGKKNHVCYDENYCGG